MVGRMPQLTRALTGSILAAKVGNLLSRWLSAAAALAIAALFIASPAYADPIYPTMNDAGGIYWRSAPDWNTPIQVSGYGFYPGTYISADLPST